MPRSKHSLGSYQLTTCNLGQLIPIGMIPVLPGDTIGHHTNALIRCSPLQAPVMHQVDVRIHHFYCANRNLWKDADGKSWERFITGGADGMNTDKVPTIDTTANAGDLLDHFGLPQKAGIKVSALPVRGFNQIFNEFYRDQDLVAERAPEDLTIPNIAWQKDYLNTARPWAQKGPQVSIPVGQRADIETGSNPGAAVRVRSKDNNSQIAGLDTSGSALLLGTVGTQDGQMYADLANATGANPIDVRRAWGFQRWAENAAKFGNRYPEKMRQLGSTYSGLMERPELLGGGSAGINFSEVLQTTQQVNETDRVGVGDMYGHGISAMRSNKYARTIGEHGFIISLLSVRPKALYQDGIAREWLRKDREDFHDPYLEFIGQQEVLNNEVWADNTDAESTGVFGYSDRYEEYRKSENLITAGMREKLDFYHLGRKFASKPTLNGSFVTCVPSKRIFQEQTEDSLWIMVHHSVAAHRNISKSATARLL